MSEALRQAIQNQRAGADPGANVFVTANAGSGKTTVLIDRIARLLLTPDADPNAFLCVTYTKAAASEMQRRLFERLGRWSVAPDAVLARELGELLGAPAQGGDDALARARGLFARALETPGGLKIQTIHAFCERLLARFPIEAGVAPGFVIADDAETAALRAEALAQTLRAQEPDVVAAFDRLAARLDADRLDRLGVALLNDRAKLARFLAQAGDLKAAVGVLAERHGLPRAPEAVTRALLEEAPWEALLGAATLLGEAGSRAAGLAEAIRAAHAAPSFESYLAIFCTKEGARKAKPIPKALIETAPWIVRLFSDEGECGRALRLRDELKAAERLADSVAALTFGTALGERYAQAKARRGALDFEDLILAGRRLLEGGGAAAWVLYKVDGGLDHILLDEGQDTSPAQWALLGPLQEEFFAGDGARAVRRTVFAVGDPKQSIYSFQGADPARFLLEAQSLSRRAFAASRPFAAPELATSFRSTPEVLAVVDRTLSLQDIGGAAPDLFNVVRHLAARDREEGLVEWWPVAPHPMRREPRAWDAPLDMDRADSAVSTLCATLAATVKRWIDDGEAVWERGALRPMRPGDVLALVRTRGQCFEQLLRAFKRVGLPVAGADRLVLKDDLAVEDLLAVAKAALDPSDDLSVACVLRGPFGGLVDRPGDPLGCALFPLAAGRGRGERLIDRLRASSDPAHRRAQQLLERAIAAAGDTPFAFFSALLEVRDEAGVSGWARLFERLGEEARDPVEELLARALEAPRAGAGSMTAFVCAIEADGAELKRQMDEAGDAVRIMTVHGAKGLEAPVVLLPDTVDGAPGRPKEGLFLDEDGLIFSPSAADDDAQAAAMAERAIERAHGEHLRLLYVALTRARDRLIICGHAKGNGAGTPRDGSWHSLTGAALGDIGAPCETPFGEGFRLGRGRRAEGSPPAVEAIAPPAWASAAAPLEVEPARLRPSGAEASMRFAGGLARAQALRRGVVMHALLQRLPDVADAERAERGRRMLAREGFEDGAEDALDAVLRVLRDPAFAEAFGPGGRAEAPIVGSVFGRPVRGAVDRMRVTPDAVLVIDFKTNRLTPKRADQAPEAYLRQMALYQAVLRQAFPDRPIRCGLLWTEVPRLDALPQAQLDAALAGFR